MKSFFLFAALIFFSHPILSQDTGRRMKSFKVMVFHGEGKAHSGFLASLSDSVLNLVPKSAIINHPSIGLRHTSYHFSDIDRVVLKRKGSVGKGALIGALAGGGIGVITGFISGDDPPCAPSNQDFFGLGYALCEGFRATAAEKAAAGGTVGVFTGAILGVCIGAIVQKRFIIGRNKDRYQKMQLTILERLYIGKH